MINTENDADILRTFKFLVLNLSGSLYNVVGCFIFWFFFLVKINLVFSVTEFTFPDLLFVSFSVLSFLSFTVFIENSLTLLTNNRITSCNLCFICKCIKLNLENICINLLSILSSNFILFLICESTSKILSLFLIVWEVHISIELIRINVFHWSIHLVIFSITTWWVCCGLLFSLASKAKKWTQ